MSAGSNTFTIVLRLAVIRNVARIVGGQDFFATFQDRGHLVGLQPGHAAGVIPIGANEGAGVDRAAHRRETDNAAGMKQGSCDRAADCAADSATGRAAGQGVEQGLLRDRQADVDQELPDAFRQHVEDVLAARGSVDDADPTVG